jgi:hypothetical protein
VSWSNRKTKGEVLEHPALQTENLPLSRKESAMELYSTFQIKDHYYWTPEAPKPEPKAIKPEPIKNPTYQSRTVREADGSITYYDGQERREVVRVDGIMI